MSSDADASSAATVALFRSYHTGGYCTVASAVLFIYDAFVTLSREVACFWTTPKTGALFLFLANKSISFTLYIMLVVSTASFPSDKSCTLFVFAEEATLILQYVPGAAFSALRSYVLSRSKFLGLLVFALSLAPVGANLVLYDQRLSGNALPSFGCIETDDTTVALDIRLVIISRAPLIVADILAIYITWTKLSSPDALRDMRQSKRLSLSDILFRNGTIYFVVLTLLNVLHLVFSVTAVATDAGDESYVTTFIAPITAILISRFLLELQEANQMVVRLDPDDPLHSSRNTYDSTPSFISSLGGFINGSLSTGSDDLEPESQILSRSEVGEGSETQAPPAAACA